ncbi:MAG: DNRLRE domain-containing protein [Cyanobacteria bacterium SBLK]|nr:DNRLRE domain-containing protein [Cyanobacteria bacterium SBLK]
MLLKGFKFAVLTILVAFFAAIAIAPVLAKETQVLSPVRDNTLIESVAGNLSNGRGEVFFVGRTNQPENSLRRGAIAFDLTEIPVNAEISAVTLTLMVERSPGGDFPIELHRILKNWGEGESYHRGGRGDRSSEGDVTWIHRFYNREMWSNLGGDFASRVSAVQTVGDIGVYTWESPTMLIDVQQWIDSPEENFGWLLLGDETTARSVKGFASRETQNFLAIPQLSVTYRQ